MRLILRSFLRSFFERLYTTLAWAYDFVAYTSSMGQWSAWQRVGIQDLPDGRILELGFGTGHLQLELTRSGHKIVGVDNSNQMTQITRRRLYRHELPARLIRAHAQELPFRQNAFQSVFSTFPSNFIFERSTLKEIYRVLEPGGVLVIIPGVESIKGPRDGRKGLIWLADTLSSWLYGLTGESRQSDDAWEQTVSTLFAEIGFKMVFEKIVLPRADVTKITGHKPEKT